MAKSLQHLREITNLDSVTVTDVLEVRFVIIFFFSEYPLFDTNRYKYTFAVVRFVY
jgi:hypothetical protein